MKLIETFFGILFLILLIFIALSKNVSFIPFNFYIVQSGSMEPIIKIADLIVVNEENEYYLNDIVTYRDTNQSIVTHRIVEKNNNSFVTKGDANRERDREEILKKQIIGKVIFKIPFIGYLLNFLQTKLGLFMLIGIPALYIAIFDIIKLKNENS